MSRARRIVAGVAVLALHSGALSAQQAQLPLDDIAYTYINALQARGEMRELPIIERPYSVGAVRAAVRAMRTAGSATRYARWLNAIDAAVEKYAPGVTPSDTGVFVLSLGGYAVGQTSGQRDLMQSNRVNTVAPGFTVRALLQSGPFTGAMRVVGDRQMRVDPEYVGRQDRAIASRTEDGYIGVASKFATLQIGRVGRSWALPGQLGLMVSNGAYTYDHAFLKLGTDRLHLSSIVARLDDEFVNFRTDTLAQRYFTAHRLGVKLGNVEAGISESVIYGGIGRGFRPSLANPTAPIFLTQYADGEFINVGFGADVLWRHSSGAMVGGQIFADDFQIDRCATCSEPPGIATAVTADGIPLAGGARAFASYTRVTALTYRAPDRFERYTTRAVGLGQRNSDFDEVRAGIDLGPSLPAPLRVYLAYRRQGEGDYRNPYPPFAAQLTWPLIFEGVVIKTLRAAASTSARLGSSVEVTADAGINRTENDRRVRGATATRFEGRLRVALEPQWGRRRLGLF